MLFSAAMLLTSPACLTFAAIFFLAYWMVSRYRLAGLGVILVANYFFYARWGLMYLALVPAASSIDFALGATLARYLPLVHSAWSWTLPLGLSFYAFQSMTYTIDIYRRIAQPAPSAGKGVARLACV